MRQNGASRNDSGRHVKPEIAAEFSNARSGAGNTGVAVFWPLFFELLSKRALELGELGA